MNSEIKTAPPPTSKTQREWEDLAHLDPLWAILSDRRMQFGHWDQQEFFAAGEREITTLMNSRGISRGNNGRVLDFGCGVGRLSRALLDYFHEVYGVDISAEMVRLAKAYTPDCIFLVNPRNDLSVFADDFFDFVYSNIVLQHQRNKEIAKSYIAEFVRVVKPGGTVVFQMPYKVSLRDALQPRRRVYSLLKGIGVSGEFLYHRLHLNPMRTISLSAADVTAALSASGGRLVQSHPDNFNHNSMTYVVTKGASSEPHPATKNG
ncbi:MAG: class I SAM-dependent methyltransferase [Candidatus Sulfotelmatobacter sp.]